MVTVMGIAAILMSIAVPSYKYITNSNRIAAEVNGLLGDMQFARGEAIKEGQTVTVCVSRDGATCLANTSWNNGWIVFSDVNGDQAVQAPNDTVLRVQAVFTSSDTFAANNTISAVTFNREGFAVANGTGLAAGDALITLHASPATDSTRCLAMNMVGMMAVQTTQTAGGACL